MPWYFVLFRFIFYVLLKFRHISSESIQNLRFLEFKGFWMVPCCQIFYKKNAYTAHNASEEHLYTKQIIVLFILPKKEKIITLWHYRSSEAVKPRRILNRNNSSLQFRLSKIKKIIPDFIGPHIARWFLRWDGNQVTKLRRIIRPKWNSL